MEKWKSVVLELTSQNKMKVAITGATGLLGRAFIEKYSNVLDIIALSRQHNVPNTVYSDFSLSSLTNIFTGVDGVIHLAAKRLYKGDSTTSNYELDKDILFAAKKAEVKNILFTSSIGVYGISSGPWKETTTISPNNFYALEKAQTELLASFLNTTSHMRIKCLRVAQVLSENEYKGGMLNTFIKNACNGEDLEVSVEGILREYIYIEDLLDAFYVALKNEQLYGIYNVGSGTGITILDIARCISEAFDSKSKVLLGKVLVRKDQTSVMDSKLFYNDFNWKPKYTFKTAMQDIASKVKNNDC